MKLHLASSGSLNTVTAHGPGFIDINGVRHTQSVIVFPEGNVLPWVLTSAAAPDIGDFAAIVNFKPEILVLGTGVKQRFLQPRVLVAISNQRIGVETMDTPAACRTFNILVAEGRKVAGAFLLDSVPS